MSVRIANLTDDMSDSEKVLELLVCMRSNLNELDKVQSKTDNMSVKMRIALQLEAQVSRAIMYATD